MRISASKTRCQCFLSKIHVGANERKRSLWRIALIGLGLVHDRLDSDFLQIFANI